MSKGGCRAGQADGEAPLKSFLPPKPGSQRPRKRQAQSLGTAGSQKVCSLLVHWTNTCVFPRSALSETQECVAALCPLPHLSL